MQRRITEFLLAAENSFVGLVEKLCGFISVFFLHGFDEHFLPGREV
jgi:hypothetical protein